MSDAISVREERHQGEEEVKKRLKSRPIPPQVKGLKEIAHIQRIQPIPRIKIDIAAPSAEKPMNLREINIKPVILKGVKLAKELKELMGGMGGVESSIKSMAFQPAKERVELKPRILRGEAPKVDVSEPRIPGQAIETVKARELLGQQFKEGLKAPTESLKQVGSGLRISVLKPPDIGVKPLDMRTTRVVGGQQREEAGKPVESPEEPPRVEEIFIPPLLERMRLAISSGVLDRPVCIVLPRREGDSFIHSTAIVCREIYRIIKGGKPEPRWISTGLRDEIEGYLRAGDRIFIVDDTHIKFPDSSRVRSASDFLDKVSMEMLLDRLRELFSQGFGFIVFHIDDKRARDFAKNLKDSVGPKIDIIELQPPDLKQHVRDMFAKICWGFVGGGGRSFDEVFGVSEKVFFEELWKAYNDVELTHWINLDGNAGVEHEGMKVIVVEILARELGAVGRDDVVRMLRERVIDTECELGYGGRADICIRGGQRFVEIETFYGTGDPLKKLDKETLSKYVKKAGRVDIVLLSGIQALLYAPELFKLREIYRREYDMEVNFYLANIVERELVPLGEVLRELKKAFSSLEPMRKLSEDDVKSLWNIFSQELSKAGIDPEMHRKIFNNILNPYKSYDENMRNILEEVRNITNKSAK